MDARNQPITWYWFKGNEVSGRLLQDICLFRSFVLFDSGSRKNFGRFGENFGDVQYSDFESYHIVACQGQIIIGTVRLTPPLVENVSLGILGLDKYLDLLNTLQTTPEKAVEINRLMVDVRARGTSLGKNLMFAAVGLIENLWDRSTMTVLGSAGNSSRQSDFLMAATDCLRIPGVQDFYSSAYNDHITFLKYKEAPYLKGVKEIEKFKTLFSEQTPIPWTHFKMQYSEKSLELESAL